MTDELDWRMVIIGYDPVVLANYLDAYGRGEPRPTMDNGQAEMIAEGAAAPRRAERIKAAL